MTEVKITSDFGVEKINFLKVPESEEDFWKIVGEKVSKLENVKNVRRMGLMIGIELESGNAHDIAVKCVENGLLIITAKDLLRMLPPLVITYEEIDEALKILENTLKEND